MTTRKPWTDAENAALIVLYFAMLDHAMLGEQYNKAAMIRNQQALPSQSVHAAPCGPLAARTRGSIEAKLMNASAAHADLDPHADTMDVFGYRALSNYQKSLKVAMKSTLDYRYELFNGDESDELGLAEFDRVQTS